MSWLHEETVWASAFLPETPLTYYYQWEERGYKHVYIHPLVCAFGVCAWKTWMWKPEIIEKKKKKSTYGKKSLYWLLVIETLSREDAIKYDFFFSKWHWTCFHFCYCRCRICALRPSSIMGGWKTWRTFKLIKIT